MIYFDNNATTQVAPEVFDAMREFLVGSYGNPSSSYSLGRSARETVAKARRSVAALLGARASEVVFTSGGTESDNWAIRGGLALNPNRNHIITTRVEHEAVRNLCVRLASDGYEITWLDVDENGHLDLDQLRDSIREATAVVSVMMANNETGVVFPVKEIAEIVKERSDALVHVDGVNAAGKVKIDLESTQIDLYSISAHKFHGPKGVGALFIRDGVSLPQSAIGGGQEMGRRAGTEAVHQIVGMGAAAEIVIDLAEMTNVQTLRDTLESEIQRRIPDVSINGSNRLPNTSNISFENGNGEAILARLDEAGICVSTGSACNSSDHKVSPVLEAMNVPYTKAMGSIRFSLGRYNTREEVEEVVASLENIIPALKRLSSG